MRRLLPGGLLLLFWAACIAEETSPVLGSGCTVEQRAIPLPRLLSESSGLAQGRAFPDVLWTHNDSGGEAAVYAIDAAGELVGEVAVEGATNRDWEDIAAGPCPEGRCLYIADTGDNTGRREEVVIYRIPEPDPRARRSVRAERFPIRYPGGPRDAEALFVLPSGEVFVVTKGGREPVEVYRYPFPLREGRTVLLERVVALNVSAQHELLQVTGADASPDGEWVAVRAYRSLMFFRTRELLAGQSEPALLVDLSPLGEAQGEAVALADDGTVTLTSEREPGRSPAVMARIACQLPERPGVER